MQTAAVIHRCGPPEVIELVDTIPVPSRAKGQVLVRLKSTSVNPVDTAVRSGAIAPKQFPKILGGDVAGVVAEADPSSRFKPGDAVAALTPGYWSDTPDGSYCQYAAVEETWLAKLPGSVDLSTVGGLPLVGLTAWQALMAASPILGQRVLITSASGGVGHVAVQIAKALGLYVVAVAGPNNVSWVKEALGADETVDYSKEDFVAKYSNTEPFDIVVDMLPANHDRCVAVLKPTGHYSHIANHGTDQEALTQLQAAHEQGHGPGVSITRVKPNGAQLNDLFELMASDKLKLEVAKLLPLEQAAEAHRLLETGRTRGKVVLQIP